MRRALMRLVILIGLVCGALAGLAALIAQADPLPPPHLGYGLNSWGRLDVAEGLGFDWIKLFEEAGPPPATRLPYQVLYRVFVDGYPTSPANFQQHIRDLVRAGRGKVEAYEIGNEVNLNGAGFWGQHKVDPEAYARLMCEIYPVIKNEDPNAIVVSAGLAPVGRVTSESWDYVMDERIYAQRMFTQMKALNAGQVCIDALGYHPHGFKVSPETDYRSVENGFAFRGAEIMHDIMVEAGAANLQLWATEFGWIRDPGSDPWIDGSGNPSSYGWCKSKRGTDIEGFLWMLVTEQEQADYLVRAFQYADANWPWMGPMFVWNLDLYYRGWACSPQRFYSLFHANDDPNVHSPALAYSSLRSMPKRTAHSNSPTLSVRPDALTFAAELVAPGLQTQTVQIDNLNPGVPMTWTAQVAGALQPLITPITGVNAATLTVQIDSSRFAVSGTYTGTISVAAEPTTTYGSPVTLEVSLTLVDQFGRVYLPLVGRNATAPPPEPPSSTITTTLFGLAFVSSAEAPAGEVRYQRAAGLNAALNRWPMYWPNIEKDPTGQPRVFDWSAQDANAIADIEHGLTVVPILMLTPPDLATAGSARAARPKVGDGLRLRMKGVSIQGIDAVSSVASPPQGLYLRVFADNSDTPGAGKVINPDNRWAVFVNAAVERYKPGGTLAQRQNWPGDKGIRHWEIWNEEDLDYFFIGSPADYARLLKVAYLSAKHADPQARIVFGGLAHFEKPNWLNDVLNEIATYPDRDANHWFMDAVATHNYSWAWQTFGYLYQDRQRLDARDLTQVRLWLTETGVPVWNDPIYPINDPNSPYRATMSEQADFLIQTATYAKWLSAEAVVWFQLVDDSGNGCDSRDAFGLVRNPPAGPCYAGDGTTRPAYDTYQVVTQYLRGVSPYWRRRPTANQELIALQNRATGERVVTMWARDYLTETVTLSATSTSAVLVHPDGITQTISPVGGVYTLTLPAATNRNTPTTDGKAPIGGSPRILIERDPDIVTTP